MPTLTHDVGLRRDPRSCTGRLIGNCYFNSEKYGLGIRYYGYIDTLISWLINCEDTETCEKWNVEDEIADFHDFTILAANPALCAAAKTGSGLRALPGICFIVSTVNIYTRYHNYIEAYLDGRRKAMQALSNMTPEELAAICRANKS
jgi:hypothetical protein